MRSSEDEIRDALRTNVYPTFPQSLVKPHPYTHIVNRYSQLLDDDSDRLFSLEDNMKVELWECRENLLRAGRKEFTSSLIQKNEEKIKIGVESLEESDPECRFIFVHALHSRSKLKITRDILTYAFTYHQVMAGGIQCEIRISPNPQAQQIEKLGRSGNDFRMCYNLKSVERSPGQKEWPWSIRQVAIYHSFDVETGKAFWTIVKADELIKKRIKKATISQLKDNQALDNVHSISSSFAESLDVHLIIFDWCLENWRWYLGYLEDKLDELTGYTLVVKFKNPVLPPSLEVQAPPDDRGLIRRFSQRIRTLTGTRISESRRTSLDDSHNTTLQQPDFDMGLAKKAGFSFNDLQTLSGYEEKANSTVYVLACNIKILANIRSNYTNIVDSGNFPRQIKKETEEKLKNFQVTVSNQISELENQLDRAKNFVANLATRKNLLNGILEYYSMESNKIYSREASRSTTRMEAMTGDMHQIAKETKRQAVSMHVITFMTLLFLPGTFISTVMSTDIIKFPKDEETKLFRRDFSLEALKLYLCTTLPLMFITVCSWFCVYWIVHHRQEARKRANDRARGIQMAEKYV